MTQPLLSSTTTAKENERDSDRESEKIGNIKHRFRILQIEGFGK